MNLPLEGIGRLYLGDRAVCIVTYRLIRGHEIRRVRWNSERDFNLRGSVPDRYELGRRRLS